MPRLKVKVLGKPLRTDMGKQSHAMRVENRLPSLVLVI